MIASRVIMGYMPEARKGRGQRPYPGMYVYNLCVRTPERPGSVCAGPPGVIGGAKIVRGV